MATYIESAFDSIAKLNLWFKVRNREDYKLSDIPSLIPYRWDNFSKEWNNIKQDYINLISSYDNPDLLKRQIDKLSVFISTQNNLNISKNPFSNGDVLYRFYTVFDVTSVFDLNLSKEESDIINDTINSISSFIRKDFIDIRDAIVIARDYLTDIVNAADEDYNNIYGRSSVEPQLNLGNANLNLLSYFQDSIKTVDFILANIFSVETITVDPFALARQNANNPKVDIGIYNSGTLVRFNYGESLQDVALRELGDSDSWIDIAIANGLKPPYIDEIGSTIPLLSNAKGNQINISKIYNNELNIDGLYVNQLIIIKSSAYPAPDNRVIKNIRQAPISGEIIIELDGNNNLSKYKISDNANIRIFKPNTINSSYLILIPSPSIVGDEEKQDIPWFLQSTSESEKRQKVDMMIGEDGDLMFTPNEDIQLSYGLENAIQAVKLKLSIESGELEKHGEYGLPAVQGLKNSDAANIEQLLIGTIGAAISQDPRFDRIEQLSVKFFSGRSDSTGTGTGFDIKINVRLAGSNSTIPITFSVDI